MSDLRLPLPPAIAGDPRFAALAQLAQDELDGIDLRVPELRTTAIDAVTDPGVLAHLAWQWHVMGIEGWDFAPDVTARRALVAAAIELHRYKGTPWAVRTALSRTLELPDAALEEADDFRRADGHWAEYQIDPGRVLARSEASAAVAVATAWAPARSRLVRLFHGYDLRAARYDLPAGGIHLLLDDWSGVDVDGVRLSFSSVFAAPVPPADRPQPVGGASPSFGAVRFATLGLRYDDSTVDGAAEPTLPRPGLVVVSAWPAPDRGIRPAFGERASMRAGIKDGMAYDDVGAVFDVPAAWRMTGTAARYDLAADAVPPAWELDVLAELFAPEFAAVGPMPDRSELVEGGVVLSVGFVGFVDRPAPVAGAMVAIGTVFEPSSAWGAGPWTDQPWGAATADFMMEV